MFKRTKVCTGLALAFGGALAFPSMSLAQDTQQLQRVEITGSSIKRVEAETALPVTVIKREDIEKSGLTTVTDLIQALPSMQGFLTSSQSVNGGGGGATNASLHSVGSKYTLVLLNGRRLAPYNTGTTVNLESIPLAAVDRIEVLTDGASALYGADAIAGVVNFILKKNYKDGEVTATASVPQHAGGKSANFSLTKGFGDLQTDRYNVMFSLSAEKQQILTAAQREFSKSGVGPNFLYNGELVGAYNTSSNTVPGTVILSTPAGDTSAFYTPAFLETGKCEPNFTTLRNGVCRFDFAGTVDDIPASDRVSLFGSGRFKVNEAVALFTEMVYSDYKTKPKYAPPAQPGIPLTQQLVDKHVTPFLSQLGITTADFAPVGDPSGNGPSMNLRLYDAGGRQDEYRTKTLHFVAGAEGTINDIDYTGYWTHSINKFSDTLLSGYTSKNALYALINNGVFDPLAAGEGQAIDILAPAVLKGKLFDQSRSTLDLLALHGSKPLMKLAGGDMAVGAGVEVSRQRFVDDPSDLSMGNNALQPTFTDTTIGGSSGALPFDTTRNAKAAYVELVAPVTKVLEVSAAVRLDNYGAAKNSRNFDPAGNPIGPATQGKSASSPTYKISARFQPTSQLLFRGSIGTGFKAPSLADITNPVQAFGNTGFHGCPPGLPAVLASACKPASSEYNLRTGGNPNSDESGLRPEKSQQATLGFRIEPSQALSFGVDWWTVRLKDRIAVVSEDVAFKDGATYASLFSVLPDPVTGTPTLTLTQQPLNQGRARYSGLDFDVTGVSKTSVGKLTTHVALTYMLRSDYEVLGLSGYQSSLGGYGPDTENVFRWLLSASTSLETGRWTNTFNLTVKPGYHDDEAKFDPVNGCITDTCVRVVKPDGTYGGLRNVSREVGAYALLDWQGKYAWSKQLSLSLGVRNIFDAKPPLSIMAMDGTGNMRGFDARYTDPLGRSIYATVSYKF